MLKSLLRLSSLLVFGFASPGAVASGYFLSALGDDFNDGKSDRTAWKTIEKLNAAKLGPGDHIFFHRGDTFNGEVRIRDSGKPKEPIVIAAYGTGVKPVLSGAVQVTSWNSFSNGIYFAYLPQAVSAVYVNNDWQSPARYPGAGFRKIKRGDKTSLVDEAAWPPGLDLTGATVRIRAVDWQYEVMTVASQTSNGIAFTDKMKYKCSPGFGYFLDNKLNFLTSPGQWFYDPAPRRLYFMPPGHIRLMDAKVEATILGHGIVIQSGVGNLEIHDLEFSKYESAAIHGMENSSQVTISNCAIRNMGVCGICLDANSKHYLIRNNQIEDVRGRGISTLESSENEISGNVIRRIGLYPGYGCDGVNNATGIAVIKQEVTFAISQGVFKKVRQQNVPRPVSDRIAALIGSPYTDEKFLLAALAGSLGHADADRYSGQIVKLVREEVRDRKQLESCDNVVADNYIEDTGYVGIRLDGHDNIAEHNIIKNTLLKMGDGGALYCWAQNDRYTFDETFRSNIIINVVGNGDGTPNARPLACGIYLDNKTHHITVANNILTRTGLGIFVNCQGHDQRISANTCYDNACGLTFNEYLTRGSLAGCRACGNILFATGDRQRSLVLESALQEHFRPVDLQNNFYCGPGPVLIQSRYVSNRSGWTNDFTLPEWRKYYRQDAQSCSIAAAKSLMLVNEERSPKTYAITNSWAYSDLEGLPVKQAITLPPFTSKIVIQRN